VKSPPAPVFQRGEKLFAGLGSARRVGRLQVTPHKSPFGKGNYFYGSIEVVDKFGTNNELKRAGGQNESTPHDIRQEKAFSEKWDEYFKFFKKFNFFPVRNVQNLVMRHVLTPTQRTALMDPEIEGTSKRKTIPINMVLSPSGAKVYPAFHVNDIVEKFGDQNNISLFSCICRHGNTLINSPCGFDMPKESCLGFGHFADTCDKLGYGRKISSVEAMNILKEVRNKGAVHCVLHEKDDISLPILAICNCCWDCCGILKPYNMGAIALKYNAAYAARIKEDANCKECGNCAKYCPAVAIALKDGKVALNSEKCIGCGQCAYQCKQNNIELYPDERTVYLPMLKKSEARINT
jgi:Pyruvate/2-oxoacid:ferredoxin oxidoreductase delta subunit